jgi:thioredoxin-related protein
MIKYFISILLFGITFTATAQQAAPSLYNPEEDAEYELSKSIRLANEYNRNVFVQIGGNWCGPCHRFNDFITTDEEISKLMYENYVVYHLNYSPENKNLPILEKYGNPHKLNFPVFIILDSTGKLIHTQRVMELVNSMGYDKKKVMDMFNNWKPKPQSGGNKEQETNNK